MRLGPLQRASRAAVNWFLVLFFVIPLVLLLWVASIIDRAIRRSA